MSRWALEKRDRVLAGRRDYATAIAGVARLGPGAVASLPADLPPGEYVMYCLVADPASGEPHIARGMLKPVRVE